MFKYLKDAAKSVSRSVVSVAKAVTPAVIGAAAAVKDAGVAVGSAAVSAVNYAANGLASSVKSLLTSKVEDLSEYKSSENSNTGADELNSSSISFEDKTEIDSSTSTRARSDSLISVSSESDEEGLDLSIGSTNQQIITQSPVDNLAIEPMLIDKSEVYQKAKTFANYLRQSPIEHLASIKDLAKDLGWQVTHIAKDSVLMGTGGVLVTIPGAILSSITLYPLIKVLTTLGVNLGVIGEVVALAQSSGLLAFAIANPLGAAAAGAVTFMVGSSLITYSAKDAIKHTAIGAADLLLVANELVMAVTKGVIVPTILKTGELAAEGVYCAGKLALNVAKNAGELALDGAVYAGDCALAAGKKGIEIASEATGFLGAVATKFAESVSNTVHAVASNFYSSDDSSDVASNESNQNNVCESTNDVIGDLDHSIAAIAA